MPQYFSLCLTGFCGSPSSFACLSLFSLFIIIHIDWNLLRDYNSTVLNHYILCSVGSIEIVNDCFSCCSFSRIHLFFFVFFFNFFVDLCYIEKSKPPTKLTMIKFNGRKQSDDYRYEQHRHDVELNEK